MALAAIKSKNTDNTDFAVPSLAEASPEYAALIARKEGLFDQKATTEREIARLGDVLRALPRALQQAKIAELVGDQVPQGESPRPSIERLNELKQHVHAIDKAIEVIESRISTERGRASAVICDHVRDEHRRRAREVCLRLLHLREAMLSYSDLAEELNDKDVSWARLSPSQLLTLGHPRDPQSQTAYYLRTMVKAGFLDQNEIPKQIR
jgi:chaperonin cofactor prefoldin